MTPVQIVPTLTILEDEGEFTVRVGSQANAASLAQSLVPVIAKLGGARKLTLITPTDIKSFKFGGEGRPPLSAEESGAKPASSPRRTVFADAGAPPTADQADEELAEYERLEAQTLKDAAELKAVTGADPDLPQEETPVKREKGKTRVMPTQNPCGRCQGQGTLSGGSACPVCKGNGKIAQWGRKTR